MNDALTGILGLAKRAGKLRMGYDACRDAADCGDAKLVLTAADLSERTKKNTELFCRSCAVTRIPLGMTMMEIEWKLGKKSGVLAVTDPNFAKRVLELSGIHHQEEMCL